MNVVSSRKISILIVDDESELSDAIAFDLKRKGCDAFCAKTGNDALKILCEREIHLVILDLTLPDISGFQLLDKMRKANRPHSAVFLMTGFGDLSVREARERGIDAVFFKPFNRKDIISAAVETARQALEALSSPKLPIF